MTSDLDNPAWSALTTLQAHLAVGDSLARRYPPDIAPIAGIGTRDRGAIDELCALVPDGDVLSLPGTLEELAPLLPSKHEQLPCKSDWFRWSASIHRRLPSFSVDVSRFCQTQMFRKCFRLVALTHPGPFRPRTHTLGTYLGIHVEGRLAAMAGQRMHLPAGAKSAPSARTRQFKDAECARTLIARLVAAIRDEGLTPFLHVEGSSVRAQERLRRARLRRTQTPSPSGHRTGQRLANVHNESVMRHSPPTPQGTPRVDAPCGANPGYGGRTALRCLLWAAGRGVRDLARSHMRLLRAVRRSWSA